MCRDARNGALTSPQAPGAPCCPWGVQQPPQECWQSMVHAPSSHLAFGLLLDPLRELDDLCIDSRTVLSGAALAPAHNSREKPASALFHADQRPTRVPLQRHSK